MIKQIRSTEKQKDNTILTIISLFKSKGYKHIPTNKGFRFNKQIGVKNCEVLFFIDYYDLIKRFREVLHTAK